MKTTWPESSSVESVGTQKWVQVEDIVIIYELFFDVRVDPVPVECHHPVDGIRAMQDLI